MALEIIGAGFGRTGTFSLKIALEQLGFGPCHHMYELRDKPQLLPAWAAAARGEPIDLDQAFAGYRAQVDWPGAAYWKRLHRHYPDARVILTVRDPQGWHDSLMATIYRTVTVGRIADKTAHARAVAQMVHDTVQTGLFGGRMADPEAATDIFRRHNGDVVQTVPAAQLLVYDVTSGWGPLCAFLGVDVPDTPFPARNTRQDFLERKQHLIDREMRGGSDQ